MKKLVLWALRRADAVAPLRALRALYVGAQVRAYVVLAVVVVTFGVLWRGDTAAAQECDECLVASYVQSGFLPDSSGHAAFQFHYRYRHTPYQGSSSQSDAPDEKVADTVLNLFYSYPLIDRVFLDVNLPVVSQAYTERPENSYSSGRDSGLGDMSLVVNTQPFLWVRDVYSIDWRMRGGVKLPTGDSGELSAVQARPPSTDSLVYPYDRALGSGSFDWILGSSLFLREDRWVGFGDAQFIGRTTGSDKFRAGDMVTVHLAPGYVFFQRAKDTVAVLLDSSLVFVDKSSVDSEAIANSGETTLSVGPRVQATLRDTFSALIGVSLPVFQDRGGRQLGTDYTVVGSLMVGF
jgi:hypothetical protein